ncbi:MAG: hypothetical protein HOJ35_13260 [Bdellovibrionales bacterium]|nr:hypothetical protein [Bdellovibrionales bacterium]
MFNKIIYLSFLVAIGCAPKAELMKADFKVFPKKVINAMSSDVQKLEFETEMRDVTMIAYPTLEEVKGFTFTPRDEVKPSWDNVVSKLTETYQRKLQTTFDDKMSDEKKLGTIVTLVQTAGEVRDGQYQSKVPLEIKSEANWSKIDELKSEVEPKIDAILDSYPCFYVKRARRGQMWTCELTNINGTRSRPKTARKCTDLDLFGYSNMTADDIQSFEIQKSACTDLKENLDQTLESLKSENDEIDTKLRDIKQVRFDGQSVVIELLESIEKYSEGTYLSSSSSKSKKLDCPGDEVGTKCLSSIKFSEDKKTIEELKLFTSFGVYAKDSLPLEEYSLGNGRVNNLKFYRTSYGGQILSFTLNTDLFVIKAKLSMSYRGDFGLRFVGETKMYHGGKVKRGIMKLEIDKKK